MANEGQVQYWNGPGAAGFFAIRRELEKAVEPYGRAALDALQAEKGQRALDVGCGFGTTTEELARRVGPGGTVVGVDVGRRHLEVAREESRAGGQVTYLVADAQTYPFTAEFDLCFSRFGLMFFDDTAAALRNLRHALRAPGRLSAVVWGPPQRCAWVELPLSALKVRLPRAVPPDRQGPGPFSLCEERALLELFREAGFAPRVRTLDLPFLCGATPGEAASFLLRFGPAGAALREAGEDREKIRHEAEAALCDALVPYSGPNGVELPSSSLLVTATAS